jgi:hypothetical protein
LLEIAGDVVSQPTEVEKLVPEVIAANERPDNRVPYILFGHVGVGDALDGFPDSFPPPRDEPRREPFIELEWLFSREDIIAAVFEMIVLAGQFSEIGNVL